MDKTPLGRVEKLRQVQSRPRPAWEVHHYVIFLDGAGASQEVGAGSEWLQEEPG